MQGSELKYTKDNKRTSILYLTEQTNRLVHFVQTKAEENMVKILNVSEILKSFQND